MQLFYCPEIKDGALWLNPEESRHCAKVLRKQIGDEIDITDGKGTFYKGILESVDPKKCAFQLSERTSVSPENYRIHLAIAPTKNTDRIEWFVEKCVEIGIDEITFLKTKHSERKVLKLDRVEKKAISAMKQSVRAFLPKINELCALDDLFQNRHEDQLFVSHLENESTPHLQELATPSHSYLVIVGPEGGFANEELSMISKKGIKAAKLGNYRLRTETAGVAACTILNALNQLK